MNHLKGAASAVPFGLASYTYHANNGKLETLTYGNGDKVKYVYDALDRVKEIWYNAGESGEFHRGRVRANKKEKTHLLLQMRFFFVTSYFFSEPKRPSTPSMASRTPVMMMKISSALPKASIRPTTIVRMGKTS